MNIAKMKDALLKKDVSQAHLSDEKLAEITTFEADGGDVEQRFPIEMAHIEMCVDCAEAYEALMEFALAAVENMDHAVTGVDTGLFFFDLIQTEVAKLMENEGFEMPAFSNTLHHLIVQLPIQFTHFPTQINLFAKIDTLFAGLENSGLWPASILEKTQQAIWEKRGLLVKYLQDVAQHSWLQPVRFSVLQTDDTYGVYPEASFVPVPTVAEPKANYNTSPADVLVKKELLTTQLGGRYPADVVVNAILLEKLACRIEIDGLPTAFYKTQLKYAGNIHAGHIADANKIVFSPIPLAALPELHIELFPK